MDNIDKRESRAEYRNSRQSSQGKGDDNNKVSNKDFNAGYSGIDWSKKKSCLYTVGVKYSDDFSFISAGSIKEAKRKYVDSYKGVLMVDMGNVYAIESKEVKDRCRGCQGTEFKVTVKDSHTQHECKKCKRVYCLFGVKG